MTQEVDSGALEQIDQSYGLAGGGSQTTDLADESISQVLSVGEMNRRSRAPFASQGCKGLMMANLRNQHPGAGELQSFVMPYAPVNAHNGYQGVDPRQFDIWIVGASSFCSAGFGANVTFGLLGFDIPISLFSMSSLATGGPVSIMEQEQPIMGWHEYTAFPTVALDAAATGGAAFEELVWLPQHMRMPTDTEITFRSEASGVVDVTCLVQMAIFPSAVGQDAY